MFGFGKRFAMRNKAGSIGWGPDPEGLRMPSKELERVTDSMI